MYNHRKDMQTHFFSALFIINTIDERNQFGLRTQTTGHAPNRSNLKDILWISPIFLTLNSRQFLSHMQAHNHASILTHKT
jgi:hypothetical protein